MCESLFQNREADEVLPATLLFKIFYFKTNKLGDKRQNIITCSSACLLAHIFFLDSRPFSSILSSKTFPNSSHFSRFGQSKNTRKRKINNNNNNKDNKNEEQLEQRPKQKSAIAVSFLSTAAAGRPFPS
jgi:uncharacterized membrane protein